MTNLLRHPTILKTDGAIHKRQKYNQNSTWSKIKKITHNDQAKHEQHNIKHSDTTSRNNEGKQIKTKTNCHIMNDKTNRDHKQLSETVILWDSFFPS